MKVVILAPSVIDFDHAHDARALENHTSIFLHNNIQTVWAVNKSCTISHENVSIHRSLDYTIYDDFKLKRINRKKRILYYFHYQYLIRKNMSALTDLLLLESISSKDHIFVPTLDWLLLSAINQLADKYQPDDWPTLHFELMFEDAKWMTGGYPYNKIIEKLNRLRKRTNRFHVYTETDAHASHVNGLLSSPAHVYPYPALPLRQIPQEKTGLEEKKITIGVLGGGRRDKGFELLPNIVEALNASNNGKLDIFFLIQKPRHQENLESEVLRLEKQENVSFLDNEVSSAAYESSFLGCSILLLPYTKTYHRRGSGVAIEALANGIPVVCSRNTGLVDAIIWNNGKEAEGALEFSEALLDISNNIALYRSNALEAKRIYLEKLFNNPVVRHIRKSGGR